MKVICIKNEIMTDGGIIAWSYLTIGEEYDLEKI